MSWKTRKRAEIHQRYFDWGDFFGTLFVIALVIIGFLALIGG